MSKRGEQEKIIQALLKKIGKALIKESEPEPEPAKTPREELLEIYTAQEPKEPSPRIEPIKTVKNAEIMLALEAIQKDKEQVLAQKQLIEKEKEHINSQHQQMRSAMNEIRQREAKIDGTTNR
jgi:hypothetical protein